MVPVVGSDDGETALFTGTEGPSRAGDDSAPERPPLQGGDPIGLQAWLRDLTYDEVHAFTVGFGPMFTALLLLPFVPRVATTLLGLSALLASAAIVEKHKPTKALRYIVREVHYFIGGQTLAAVLGIGWVGLVSALGHLAGVVA